MECRPRPRTRGEVQKGGKVMEGFGWGLMAGIISCLCFVQTFNVNIPTALDVYRGKTTLEITYRDSVAIDSTVVYKVK